MTSSRVTSCIILSDYDISFPREEISLQHKLIPKYMANWNIVKAVAAAERKLELVKMLEGEMKTLLPSSLLELYEMYRLALVRTKSITLYHNSPPHC